MTNHPSRAKVVTWQASNGGTINLTEPQRRRLEALKRWPKNSYGQEYCTVSHGLHVGEPTYSDDAFENLIDSLML